MTNQKSDIMKKSQMLQLTENFLSISSVALEDFYSINLWNLGSVNLQGKYDSKITRALTEMVFTINSVSGYVEASTTLTSDEGETITVNITLT